MEFRVVVDSPLKIAEFPSILVAVDSSGGKGADGRRIGVGDVVNTGDQVHEEIPGEARAVVLVATPGNEAASVEGPFRRVAQPSVPVNGLFVGVGRDGIDPGAAVGVAIPDGFDGVHLTQPAGVPDFLGLGIKNGTDALAADLQDALVRLNRLDHGKAVFERVRHGFFAVGIFAGLRRFDHQTAVPMVGRRDNHGVNVLAVEEAAIFASGVNVLLQHFLGGLVPRVVQICGGHALNTRHATARPQQVATFRARADDAEAHDLRRRRPGRSSEKARV